MPFNFREYDPGQMFLLPPSLDEWVPEGSLARFVSHVLEELQERGRLKQVFDRYREDGWGRAAYHPLLMLKILLYGYCVGVTSSRKIAKALETDVAFRYLSGNQQPDFRTISEFRRRHLSDFEGLFVEILELCKESGMVKMGRVALDGRRVQGNANRKKNRTKESLLREREELEEIVRKILEEAERVDQEEDEIYKDERGDELPKDLRTAKDRKKRIQECLDRLEAKEKKEKEAYEQKLKDREEKEKSTGRKPGGRKPLPPEEKRKHPPAANPTDPDSRVIKLEAGHWRQGYNGQAAADCKTQVIVGHGLTNQENDHWQLEPMLEAIEKQCGRPPTQLVADAGYWNETNLRLDGDPTDLYIAANKGWKQSKAGGVPRGRPSKSATIFDHMRRKLLTKRGRKIYKSRAPSIEGVFGQMWSRGLQRFWLRGLKKVSAEWSLWCLSHNLLKLYRQTV